MGEINWVQARSECSLIKVFELLKAQVKQDIDDRNALRNLSDARFKFQGVDDNGQMFMVYIDVHGAQGKTVIFALTTGALEVRDKNHKPTITASVTLNNDGECRLKVAGEELELWQVRKMALESLFFE
jgi:hypothetical protein